MKIIDELDQIGLNLDMDFEAETKSKDELIIGESNKRQSIMFRFEIGEIIEKISHASTAVMEFRSDNNVHAFLSNPTYSTVLEMKCQDVPKQKCQTDYGKKCQTRYGQQCTTNYNEKCTTKEEKE